MARCILIPSHIHISSPIIQCKTNLSDRLQEWARNSRLYFLKMVVSGLCWFYELKRHDWLLLHILLQKYISAQDKPNAVKGPVYFLNSYKDLISLHWFTCGVQASDRSLRRALLMFETCRVAQYPLTSNQELPFPDWEMYIKVILNELECHYLHGSLFVLFSGAVRVLYNTTNTRTNMGQQILDSSANSDCSANGMEIVLSLYSTIWQYIPKEDLQQLDMYTRLEQERNVLVQINIFVECKNFCTKDTHWST